MVASRTTRTGLGAVHAREHPTDLFEIRPGRRGRLDEHVAGAQVRVVHELGNRRHLRHARVGRTELRDPVVTRAVRDRGPEVGADRVLHLVVGLVREPLLAPERAAQVGVEVRLDRADRDPFVVGAAVHVVTRVAPGEDVVARTRDLAGREVLVDVQRHERDHAVGDRYVEVRALAGGCSLNERGEDRDHGLHAAARGVADRRARASAGPPSASRPEQSR